MENILPMVPVDELLVSMKFVADAQPGCKPIFTARKYMPPGNIILNKLVRRTWYWEDAKSNIIDITRTVQSAITALDRPDVSSPERQTIRDGVSNMLPGINNLIVTFSDHPTLQEDLKEALEKLTKAYHASTLEAMKAAVSPVLLEVKCETSIGDTDQLIVTVSDHPALQEDLAKCQPLATLEGIKAHVSPPISEVSEVKWEPGQTFHIKDTDQLGRYYTMVDSAFLINNDKYTSVEQYFEASKCIGNPQLRQRILRCSTAHEALNQAKQHLRCLPSTWLKAIPEPFAGDDCNLVTSQRDAVMLKGMLEKFSQSAMLRAALLATGKAKLMVQNADSYWSATAGADGVNIGQNKEGRMLEYLRHNILDDRAVTELSARLMRVV